MKQTVDQVLNSAEDLKNRMQILVEEAGAYKAAKEGISNASSHISELSSEVFALSNSIKTLVDELKSIDFCAVERLNQTVLLLVTETRDIKKSFEDASSELKTSVAQTGVLIIDNHNKTVESVESCCQQVGDKLAELSSNAKKNNRNVFIVGVSISIVILTLLILCLIK